MTDQRGCVHTYDYDAWGRLTADRVTTSGTGVDATILCIGRTYETLGRVATIRSYSSNSTSGTVVNQIPLASPPGRVMILGDGDGHGTIGPMRVAGRAGPGAGLLPSPSRRRATHVVSIADSEAPYGLHSTVSIRTQNRKRRWARCGI